MERACRFVKTDGVRCQAAFREGVIRGFYPIWSRAVRKTGDGEIPKLRPSAPADGLNVGRDGQKVGVFYARKLAETNPAQGVRAF